MSSRRTTTSADDPHRVAQLLLARAGLELVSLRKLQTLWAGYGQICSIDARSATGEKQALILKLIAPPRGSGRDEGHLRKMLSYAVEQYFYAHVAPGLPGDVGVARCVASTSTATSAGTERAETELSPGTMAMLLTDLRPAFPIAGEKRSELDAAQVYSAIDWLAKFHAASWAHLPDNNLQNYVLPPLEETTPLPPGKTLWLNGGYTYLATRRTEFATLQRDKRSEWSTAFCASGAAQLAAAFLTPRGRPHESLIHGDVKSENLFSSADGKRVAFFDFQYVGLGYGVCDLAKLFTCSVPEGMLAENIPHALPMDDGERQLLETYRSTLLAARPDTHGPHEYSADTLVRHWETALVDWCRFQASWGFWGNTDWLEARVRHVLADGAWRAWIEKEMQGFKAG